MFKRLFIPIFVCILFIGFCLYSYIDLQNEITNLRIQVPKLGAKVRKIEEENLGLLFEIEKFENPENLMKIAQKKEFSHLRFPFNQEVLSLKASDPLLDPKQKFVSNFKAKSNITFATGSP